MNLPYGTRFHAGTTSSATTTARASAAVFQTPNSAISSSRTPSQNAVLTPRRKMRGCASQRDCGRPTAPSADHQYGDRRRRTSAPFRCPLAEQAFGAEDEDED